MAFKQLITNSVNLAFNVIQDLAEDVIFTNVTDVSYDFDTGDTTETAGSTVTIKGVISKMSKDINDNTIFLAEVLLKTEDAAGTDLDNYDTITFRNKSWKINSLEDNGFLVVLQVARKV